MASIKMVAEADATGDVRRIYEEIKTEFGIDFVPNLYRVMATNPAYLAANWNRVKAIMFTDGRPRQAYQGDHRGHGLRGAGMSILTECPHFCGAEAGARRSGSAGAHGGGGSVQRIQQADRRPASGTRRKALVWLRSHRRDAVSILIVVRESLTVRPEFPDGYCRCIGAIIDT